MDRSGRRFMASGLPVLLAAVHCAMRADGVSAAAANDTAAESPAGIELSPCTIAGLAQPARCGELDVAENPNLPKGRSLAIHVAVVPAFGDAAVKDPIVVLMGGPGEEAIGAAAAFTERLASLRDNRDVLLVDQRGTGRSAALQCDLYSTGDPAASLRDLFPPPAVKHCLEKLRSRADLAQYTYLHFANDLERVRRALGYGSLNLFAGSYGTRAAQVYLRAYPASVRTAYLGSVVPIDVPTPLTMAKTAEAALEKMFEACADDVECHAAFPGLRAEFRQALDRLGSGTVRVSIPGVVDNAALDRGRVAEWVRAKLYRPSSAATLPWMIHQAFQGNWNPIAQEILADVPNYDSSLSFGLFFSITCNDDVAFIDEPQVTTQTRGTFLGAYRIRQQQVACESWPKVSMAPDYRAPVRSAVPTLFVSGDSDAATPLWFTEHAAKGFSRSAQVVLRNQGHTEWNACIDEIYRRFVRSGTVQGLSTRCEPAAWPPFKTR